MMRALMALNGMMDQFQTAWTAGHLSFVPRRALPDRVSHVLALPLGANEEGRPEAADQAAAWLS